jgi:hypothetical protein
MWTPPAAGSIDGSMYVMTGESYVKSLGAEDVDPAKTTSSAAPGSSSGVVQMSIVFCRLEHDAGLSLIVTDASGPKLSPTMVITVPPAVGAFGGMIDDTTGGSKSNATLLDHCRSPRPAAQRVCWRCLPGSAGDHPVAQVLHVAAGVLPKMTVASVAAPKVLAGDRVSTPPAAVTRPA